jgi:hypothetical protein
MVGRIKDSDQGLRQALGIVVSEFNAEGIGKIRSFLGWQQALAAVGLAE